MKKLYIEPELEIIKISINQDILTSSQETPFTEPSVITEPTDFPPEEDPFA